MKFSGFHGRCCLDGNFWGFATLSRLTVTFQKNVSINLQTCVVSKPRRLSSELIFIVTECANALNAIKMLCFILRCLKVKGYFKYLYYFVNITDNATVFAVICLSGE